MKRYFYISFAHSEGFGFFMLETDGGYVNHIAMLSHIMDMGYSTPHLFAPTELSENDYKDFIKTS